jgi:hypothetical protein
MTVASLTLSGGAIYQFQINDATGGAGTGWDLVNSSGAITLNGSNAIPITIQVQSLTLGNASGTAANFDGTQSYSFLLASGSSISGFSPTEFTVDSSLFQNSGSGVWSVTQSGNSLELDYSAVPEPSSYALLAGGGALLLAGLRRRGGKSRSLV